jgi:hypothetical protein
LEGYSPYLQFPGPSNGFNKDTGRSGIVTESETKTADCGSEGTPDTALRFKIAFTPTGKVSEEGTRTTDTITVTTVPKYYAVIYVMKIS